MIETLNNILTNIDSLIPQLTLFIDQFNDVITDNGINVFTDTSGNMSIDVPKDMSDKTANSLATRVRIIDSLISERSSNLDELFKQGFDIEKDIKKENPQYRSQIVDKAKAFKELKQMYKH
jgi:hypothetical protein